MSIITDNPIGFVKVLTLIIGIFTIFFTGDLYQEDEILELVYFIVVVLFFSLTLLWTLAIFLVCINADDCLRLEVGVNIASSLVYLGGVICFVLDFIKEDHAEIFPGKKIITTVFGFITSILYGCTSILIIKYLKKNRNSSSA